MEVQIFVGIVYYQRLRHMVSDKDQVRAQGTLAACLQSMDCE
jgi:DNA-directed RNA polymerase I subunit RPA2